MRSPLLRLGIAAVAVAGLLQTLGVDAQQRSSKRGSANEGAAGQPSYQEVVDVRLVNLDVVAVDRNGNLVSDLRPEDFAVTDDGKKVKIDYFGRLGEAAGATGEGAAPAAADDPRRFVVFIDLDTALIPERNRVLDELSAYLDAHGRNTSAMVVTYGRGGLDVGQPFSTSPAEWSAAIAAAKEMPSRGVQRRAEQQRMIDTIRQIQTRAEHGGTMERRQARQQLSDLIASVRIQAQNEQIDATATLRAIQTLASVLATIPGPKSMLYVGDGVPVRPGEDLFNLLADVFEGDDRFTERSGFDTGGSSSGQSGGSSGGGGGSSARPGNVAESTFGPMMESTNTLRSSAMDFDLAPVLRAVTATANSQRVTLYGLSSDSRDMSARADVNLGAHVPHNAAAAYDTSRSSLREESLQRMAEDTGGLALPPDAAVPPFLDRLLADAGSRYSLAYPSPHGGDSKYHKIKVKVARRGVDLRFREGYIDRPNDIRVADLVAAALLFGSGENPHRFEIGVVSQEPAENDRMTVTLKLRIPIEQLQLTPAGEQHETRLDLYLLSRDASGDLAPVKTVSFTAAVPAAAMGDVKGKFYGATVPLVLDKGKQAIAVGMVEPGAQRTSVSRAEIEVGGPGEPSS
jgi:VWFA-related protein